MLELQHIHKMYNPGTINEICLFEDFNLKIEDGQFVSVVGSNGSGKTSMLNIICGSIPVDAGKILVNGVDISRQKDYIRHRRIGRVFQDPSKGTCPSMTILENLAIADNKGKAYGLGRGTNHARMDAYRELLASVGLGLEDKMHTKVGALSGGQRQTLALLMATMKPIEFLILDEHKKCQCLPLSTGKCPDPTMREWMRIVNFLQVLGWDWKTRCIQRSGHFPVDSGRHWHFLWRL